VGVGGLVTAGVLATDRTPPGALPPPVTSSVAPTLPPGTPLRTELGTEPGTEPGTVPGEDLAYGAVDVETMTWLTDLQAALAGDPGFGTVALSPDRSTVTITWFGEHSTALQAQVAAAPAGVAVVVQPADFRPADLQELVGRAMVPDLLPGIRVTMGGAENDGSGLRIGIQALPRGRTLEDVAAQLADALGRPDVPITVEVADVMAVGT
jgi:hypothetical protein